MLTIRHNGPFDLTQTFECGQCFRWVAEEDGSYTGITNGAAANISLADNIINIVSTNERLDFWLEYLDLTRDYLAIQKRLSKDRIVKKALETGRGIKILKQQPWECLMSFIISQNNNIPRIKKIINSLCQLYGEERILNGKSFYTFPAAEIILEADISPIKSGFREKYIKDAAYKVASGKVDLDAVYNMDYPNALEYLKQIKGVGNKVADCVLLFAYQQFNVFPADVWIKRTVSELYGVNEKDIADFAQSHFKNDSGFAQQYLFYKARG